MDVVSSILKFTTTVGVKLVLAGLIAFGFVMTFGGFKGRQGSSDTDPALGIPLLVVGVVGIKAVDYYLSEE